MTKAERRKWSRKKEVVKVVEQSKQTENREASTGAGTVEGDGPTPGRSGYTMAF